MFIHNRLKLKVTATTESQSQSATETLDKWTEIIEDLWDQLPHFQQWYDEDCLKFDCVKLQFGDGEEISNDDEMWLDQNCEEESPAAIEENKQFSESKLRLFIAVYSRCNFAFPVVCLHDFFFLIFYHNIYNGILQLSHTFLQKFYNS